MTDDKKGKRKLSKEDIEAMLKKTCMGRNFLVLRRVNDFNDLAAFLKANDVTGVKLGEEELTYEIVNKENVRAGAFILTRRKGAPDGSEEGSTWFIAVMRVAPDFRGQKLGDIMVNKVKNLLSARGINKVYVELEGGTKAPDDMEGVTDAKSFWNKEGFSDDGMTRMKLEIK